MPDSRVEKSEGSSMAAEGAASDSASRSALVFFLRRGDVVVKCLDDRAIDERRERGFLGVHCGRVRVGVAVEKHRDLSDVK